MKYGTVTPCKAVTYYIWFLVLGACLALIAFCSGCGNVAVPELAIVAPSPSVPPPNSLPLVATVSVAYSYPVSGDAAHREVWLAALVLHADEATRIEWDFGDGSPVRNTYGDPGTVHIYPLGTWVVTIRAITTNGRTATGSTRFVLP